MPHNNHANDDCKLIVGATVVVAALGLYGHVGHMDALGCVVVVAVCRLCCPSSLLQGPSYTSHVGAVCATYHVLPLCLSYLSPSYSVDPCRLDLNLHLRPSILQMLQATHLLCPFPSQADQWLVADLHTLQPHV